MYRLPIIVLLVSFAFMSLKLVYADPAGKEHAHKTPHGGILQEAEGVKAEFLIDKDGQPKLYLYDKAMKVLERTDVATKLVVKGHDGAQHNRELKAVKDPKGGMVYQGEPIKGLKDWDTAVVSIKIKDTWTHVRFSHHH
jgi:hypothetical protein